MPNALNCPKCGSATILSGRVSCWCDKDFCSGQRCGANDLADNYACTNKECEATGTPPETSAYYSRHSPKN